MNEIAETVLSIIELVSIVAGVENGAYWALNKCNKHWVSYILHGFALFLVALDALYP